MAAYQYDRKLTVAAGQKLKPREQGMKNWRSKEWREKEELMERWRVVAGEGVLERRVAIGADD